MPPTNLFGLGYGVGPAGYGYPSVGSAAPPTLSYASPQSWTDYVAITPVSPTTTGATSFAVTSGALPAGVSLDTGTGVLSGTPTALKTAANVEITATGPGGSAAAVVNIEVLWLPSTLGTVLFGVDTAVGFSSIKAASDGSGSESVDTEPCGCITDLSGNGDHAIQATSGAKPTVDADGIASKRVISLDGGDLLQDAGFAAGAAAQPNTIVWIGEWKGVAGEWLMASASGSARQELFTAANWQAYAGNTLVTGQATDANLHLHVALFNGASSAYYLDGTSIGTGDAGTDGMDGITIGALFTTGGRVTNGTLFAVAIVFAGSLDATARAALKAWAVAKWGTPA